MFSCAWHRFQVFPRMATVSHFPVHGNGAMFSSPGHRLHIFPRFAPVSCFSCPWHRLPVFPRFAMVSSFPVFDIYCMSSRAWHRLPVFPRLAPVPCFLYLATDVDTGYKLFLHIHIGLLQVNNANTLIEKVRPVVSCPF